MDTAATGASRKPGVGRAATFVILINSLIFVAGSAFVIFIRNAAGIALYDFNFDTFHDVLNETQRTGIVLCTQDLIVAAALPLVVTNVAWFVLVLILMRRLHRSTG